MAKRRCDTCALLIQSVTITLAKTVLAKAFRLSFLQSHQVETISK
ncbi:hypothetical protein M2451_000108 [Dysgonomonas sp. PFB1-18]|nr:MULTISPECIES: hypothetical protein [unclassified Dysgonomonas]MDH6307659.1 hypothetical protein [Dysgonomonas sp. PF1-14]MDH6337577.1 hypothetical protein [Dysgonomonas sp. PF1-16]MDH6378801.1 hypothetical protein [Dysgonomonas sp. PFB1-18]MDH6396436.1 hypothetical protein [Dysgonomonas sp. PF1-23]